VIEGERVICQRADVVRVAHKMIGQCCGMTKHGKKPRSYHRICECPINRRNTIWLCTDARESYQSSIRIRGIRERVEGFRISDEAINSYLAQKHFGLCDVGNPHSAQARR
jgi:hypothetical protein